MKKNTTTIVTPRKGERYIRMAPEVLRERQTQDRTQDAEKVLRALSELLHNPQTPSVLFEGVAEFVTQQSNECGDDLWYSDFVLTKLLRSVPPADLRGAIIAARETEEGKEVSDAAQN